MSHMENRIYVDKYPRYISDIEANMTILATVKFLCLQYTIVIKIC